MRECDNGTTLRATARLEIIAGTDASIVSTNVQHFTKWGNVETVLFIAGTNTRGKNKWTYYSWGIGEQLREYCSIRLRSERASISSNG